jgi:outer membrane cobalamin receptor
MQRTPLSLALAAILGTAFVCASPPATAQPDADAAEREARNLDTIVVQAEIAYRNRSAETAPTLVYDLEYFQRFEPLTVGDMLKRVPSVSFLSDVPRS